MFMAADLYFSPYIGQCLCHRRQITNPLCFRNNLHLRLKTTVVYVSFCSSCKDFQPPRRRHTQRENRAFSSPDSQYRSDSDRVFKSPYASLLGIETRSLT